MIGKYSFSILMIHWLILHNITVDTLGLTAASFGVAGGTALSIAVTLALSLLFAIIFDNTVVISMETLFLKFCGLFGRKSKREYGDPIRNLPFQFSSPCIRHRVALPH